MPIAQRKPLRLNHPTPRVVHTLDLRGGEVTSDERLTVKEVIERSGIQVIARAATIMNAVAAEPEGLSLVDIAERVGLARSTVQRIVAALLNERFLTHAALKARVKIGPALARMAEAGYRDVGELVRPVMQDLSSTTGETVDLSLLRGQSAVFIDQVLGTQRLVAVSAIGARFPLHCTANGKAILALRSPARRKELLPTELERYTDATIVDHEVLEREVNKVAATGVAWDLEEHSEGICALGFGFEDLFGRAYAISLPVPAPRFMENRKILRAHVSAIRPAILEAIKR